MFLGWLRNISSYIPRCHVAEEHNLCSSAPIFVQSYIHQDMFISSYVPRYQVAEEYNLCSSASMSVQSYVHQDMFFSYVSRLTEEYKLYSSVINICFPVFDREIFVCFL
jgi:hypothetical protein